MFGTALTNGLSNYFGGGSSSASSAASGALDWKNLGSGFGSIGAGLGALFGSQNNPADAAMPYLNQIKDTISPYYQPYINAGQEALPQLQQQYGNLLNNPGGVLNEMGGQFNQSPGFEFALKQALQGGNHAAAAGGMAGSPQHEQQNMSLATNLANQDYYNYLDKASGLYGAGLQGTQNLATQGLSAGSDLAGNLAQSLIAQSMLAYMGQSGSNSGFGEGLGSLIGGVATVAPFFGL